MTDALVAMGYTPVDLNIDWRASHGVAVGALTEGRGAQIGASG